MIIKIVKEVDFPPGDAEAALQPWEPATADELDREVYESALRVQGAKERAAEAKLEIANQTSRIARLLEHYGHLIAAEAPVKPGGQYSRYLGRYSRGLGGYNHNPARQCDFHIVDKERAKAAGVAKPTISYNVDTGKCRELSPEELNAAGVLPVFNGPVEFNFKGVKQ